jgi:hypothetical protein
MTATSTWMRPLPMLPSLPLVPPAMPPVVSPAPVRIDFHAGQEEAR